MLRIRDQKNEVIHRIGGDYGIQMSTEQEVWDSRRAQNRRLCDCICAHNQRFQDCRHAQNRRLWDEELHRILDYVIEDIHRIDYGIQTAQNRLWD